MATAKLDYSDEVLEATPERVTKLLTALGAVPTIRTVMFEAGMVDEEIVEGRDLLLAVLAAPRGAGAPADTDDAKAQRGAVATLDQWDEPNFARFGAALRRRFPDQAAYVFHELSASQGVAAVHGVATFLTRLDHLEKGTDEDRSSTKKEDKKAVELLATRGLDKAERARLRELVEVALGPTSPLPSAPPAPSKEARRAALVELRAWYDEWASTARAVVKKRSYLIRLGLATRKPPTRKPKAPADPKK